MWPGGFARLLCSAEEERERETDPQQALAAKLLQVSVQGYKCSMTTYHGKGWAKGQQCSRAAGANSGKRSNKLGLTGVFVCLGRVRT